MILFFYNLALFAALVVSAPWWLWKMATTHKYREGMLERLGRMPAHLKATGRPSDEAPVIWLHAVSVGEVLAVSRLVTELERAFPEARLLISTTTRTGQALARQRFGSHRVFYCPLDLPWAVNSYLNSLRPRMLILTETEFWPNLLSGCYRRGIPVTVVNARISDRSWPRYLRLRPVFKAILARMTRVLAQSAVDAERLSALGCQGVSVAGNLKFDVRVPEESAATRNLKELAPTSRIVVAGSTLEGEEAALLEAWHKLLAVDRNLVLVLAPRHPERFSAVGSLLREYGAPWFRRSNWSDPPEEMDGLGSGNIVLLDTIGELASVYSVAAVAFVGGSLVPAGGHNPLEPAQFGVPIVMGPHYANFAAITDDLRKQDALRIATKEDLAATLIELLTSRSAADAMGARAKKVFEQQAGATARCVEAIGEVLASVERPA